EICARDDDFETFVSKCLTRCLEILFAAGRDSDTRAFRRECARAREADAFAAACDKYDFSFQSEFHADSFCGAKNGAYSCKAPARAECSIISPVARITLGLGTSHGPMLSVPPEIWPERVKADRANPRHFYRGKTYTFHELVAFRKQENLDAQITAEVCRERHARCQQAIGQLADIWDANSPDIAVVVGNDQMEVFTRDHVPAFAVFWGEFVEGIPRTAEFLATLQPGIAAAEADRTPREYTRYPTLPELGRHII